MTNWITIFIIDNKNKFEDPTNKLQKPETTSFIENLIVADKVVALFLTLVVYFFVFQM